jgi:hypothetical protein
MLLHDSIPQELRCLIRLMNGSKAVLQNNDKNIKLQTFLWICARNHTPAWPLQLCSRASDFRRILILF